MPLTEKLSWCFSHHVDSLQRLESGQIQGNSNWYKISMLTITGSSNFHYFIKEVQRVIEQEHNKSTTRYKKILSQAPSSATSCPLRFTTKQFLDDDSYLFKPGSFTIHPLDETVCGFLRYLVSPPKPKLSGNIKPVKRDGFIFAWFYLK